MEKNRRKLGEGYEEAVCSYLRQQGVRITERNYRCSQGEVDIIGFHRDCLVFIEVKYRSGPDYGNAQEAVDGRKQRKICKTADWYLYRHGLAGQVQVRFDVVAVNGESICWYPNAFPYQGKCAW